MAFLKSARVFVLGFIVLGQSVLSHADEVAYSFNYQGRLMSNDGTTPLSEAVDFTLAVLGSTGTCLLYEETQRVDLSSTNGLFSVLVGSPVGAEKRSARDPGLPLPKLFANKGVFIRQDDGSNGTCPGGYRPAAGAGRILKVTVSSRSLGQITLTPDLAITSVSQAYVAETLQGLAPSDLAQQGKDANFSSVRVAPSGTVTLGNAPQQDFEAATKRYVDDKVTTVNNSVTALSTTLGTPSSANTASAVVQRDSSGNFSSNLITVAPISTLSPNNVVTNKGYVDTQLNSLGTPSKTADTVVKRDGSGAFFADLKGNVTGNLTGNVVGDVTGSVTGVASGNLPIAGGALTGPLYLSGDPTDPAGAATKRYVDNRAQGGLHNCQTYEWINPLANIDMAVGTTTAGIKGYQAQAGNLWNNQADFWSFYRMTCPIDHPYVVSGGGWCDIQRVSGGGMSGSGSVTYYGVVRDSSPQASDAWGFSCAYPYHGEGALGGTVNAPVPANPGGARIRCCQL